MIYYHYDRRNILSQVIGWKKVFRNNRGLLNGFFIGLGTNNQAKIDFGKNLIEKVNNYADDESSELDFLDEIISRIEETDNVIIKKVLYEFIFEDLRRKEYNSTPSRLKSIFAVKEQSDLEKWKTDKLGENGISYKLTALDNEIVIFHEADSNWFELCDFNDIENARIYADKYWKGIKSDNPQNELLLIGEFECEAI